MRGGNFPSTSTGINGNKDSDSISTDSLIVQLSDSDFNDSSGHVTLVNGVDIVLSGRIDNDDGIKFMGDEPPLTLTVAKQVVVSYASLVHVEMLLRNAQQQVPVAIAVGDIVIVAIPKKHHSSGNFLRIFYPVLSTPQDIIYELQSENGLLLCLFLANIELVQFRC